MATMIQKARKKKGRSWWGQRVVPTEDRIPPALTARIEERLHPDRANRKPAPGSNMSDIGTDKDCEYARPFHNSVSEGFSTGIESVFSPQQFSSKQVALFSGGKATSSIRKLAFLMCIFTFFALLFFPFFVFLAIVYQKALWISDHSYTNCQNRESSLLHQYLYRSI